MLRRDDFNAAEIRRLMTKTTTIIVMSAGLTLGTALAAHAQTQTESKYTVNVSAGGQFQSRDFSPVKTFTLYDEEGTVTSNQTVGSGFVFDASVWRRFYRNVSAGAGFSTSTG